VYPRADVHAEDPLPHLDYAAFAAELDALGRELRASLGPADFAHHRRLARIGRTLDALGHATAWLAPNPLSAGLLATGSMARWAIVAHHVSHRGLDRIPGVPEHWTSRGFAKGWRRYVDWLDWISPEAWDFEHNKLHHYHTGERLDPDLVEENMAGVRDADWPRPAKLALAALIAASWKITYYAPSTHQVLRRGDRLRAAGRAIDADAMRDDEPYLAAFDLRTAEGRRFWRECVLPYGLTRFVVTPALFAPLGPLAALNVLLNVLGAEVLTNLYTFAIIVPNHTGEDLHRFEGPNSDRPEFYVRQILSSTNFTSGGPVRDFLHGYLNYQIEHHLWPDLPPAAYARAAPKVREICARHGVPYVEESVFTRTRKAVAVMIGDASLRRSRPRTRREREAESLAAE